MEQFFVLRELLRPLVRYCLRSSIRISDALEALKHVFLEEAQLELERRGDKATTSRLNVMTGIHRRDVTRIVEGGVEIVKPSQSLATRVLGKWEQEKRYQTKAGKPRQLTFEGEGSEFEKLVRSVSKEIGPKAILAELERIGSVERRAGKLKLTSTTVNRHKDPAEGLKILSRDINTYATLVEENIYQKRKDRNHHNRTEFDDIYVSDVPKVREWLFKEGAKFHTKVRNFIAKHDKEINPKSKDAEAGQRVIFLSASWTDDL